MFNFNFNRPTELFNRAAINAETNPMVNRMAEESLGEVDNRENIKVFDPKKFIRNQMLSTGITGLQRLSNLSGNSYQNALLRFNAQQTPNLNQDQYSTNQDLYGMNYAKHGGLKSYDDGGNYQNLANEYNFLAQENPEDADFFQSQAAQYQQQFQEFQQKQFQDSMFTTLEAHAANVINPQQEDIYQYTPQPWSTTLNSEFLTQAGNTPSVTPSYTPSFAPSINVGFNVNNNMFNKSQSLQGMQYQMGAKGSNGKIDCSGAVCKIVGAPTQTSEDVTRHGKNFRKFQGVQDLQEGAVLGFDFGPKKHDRGRQHGIDHTGVVVRNPKTKQLEYKESVSGTGFRTLTIPQLMAKYPSRAKQIFISNYQ